MIRSPVIRASRRSRTRQGSPHRVWVLLVVAACAAACARDSSMLVDTIPAPATLLAAASDAPVVVPPLALCTKETACLELLAERAFDCLSPVECESGWGVSGRFSIVQEPSAPKSPSNVGQVTYPAGFSGGSAPGSSFAQGLNHRRLHVTAWIRFSPNFQNHVTGTNKVFHLFVNGINRLFFYASGTNLVPAFGLQQLAAPFDNGAGHVSTTVNLLPNVGSASMERGQWYRVDLVLVANAPGVADGSVQLFLDGRRVSLYNGIMFAAAGGNGRWGGFNWSPTWGGTGGTVSEEMYLQVDHIVIRGSN